jgi:uncharacterized protein YndB with AHSA1/START domain
MGRNTTWIDAPPEQVFGVLSDPYSYDDWVVGTTKIRNADPEWPALGTKLHHTVGFPPLGTKDHTRVVSVKKPERLELDAVARPFGRAKVELLLEASGLGTKLTIIEDPSGWTAPLRLNPAVHALIRLRNTETLRRLKAIAERREP